MHEHPWKQTKLRNLKAYSYEELLAMENGHVGPTSSHHGPYIVGGDSDDVGSGLKIVNSKDFPTNVAPRPCVVDLLVPEKCVTSLYGTSGVVKSTLVLDLLLSAARGDEYWLGRRLGGQYKSVFIDLELDLEEQAKRARQLSWGHGHKDLPPDFNYICGRGHSPGAVFTHVYKECERNRYNLLGIDSAGLAMAGDATKYIDVITFFQRILDAFIVNLGCTVILIDHQPTAQAGESYQSKVQFGSSYKGNLTRSRVQLQLQESSKGVRRITLRHNKANFTDYADPFDVTVRFMGDAITLQAESMDIGDLAQESQLPAWKRVLLILYKESSPMARHNIASSVGISDGSASNALTNLRKREFICDTGRAPDGTNPVEITTKGSEFVDEFLSAYTNDIITSHPPYKDHDDDDVTMDPSVEKGDKREASFTYITKLDDLGEVHEWIQRADGLGIDLETTGLDPDQDRICLLQLSNGEATYILDALSLDLKETVELLDGKRLVAHNAVFEERFLKATYGVELDIQDTLLMAQVLEQGDHPSVHTNSYSLEAVCERHLSVTMDKSKQKSDWSLRPLTTEQLSYAAEDARVLPNLYATLERSIVEAGLEEVLGIDQRAAPAFRWMEETGVYVDCEALKTYITDLEERAEDLRARLKEFADINWNSGPQLVEFFGLDEKKKWPKTDKGIPSTKADHLRRLKHPAVKPLLELKKVEKNLSTYGEKWLARIAEDGRIHAKFLPMGTVTGRTACTNPNLQNIPHGTPHRAAIIAPEGRVLIKADYSQIELRIAAKYAPDDALLGLYRSGNVDVHIKMASSITGKPESKITKAERAAAKAANFGPLYGAGAKTLRETARKAPYFVEWSLDEAKKILKTFGETYPGIAAWHKTGYKPHETNRSELAPTRTFAGRRRRYFKSVMDWFNTPVQGTGADGAKLAMAFLYERRSEVPSMAPVLFVHDEIVVECDQGDAEATSKLLKRCMQDGMEAVLNKDEPRVPVVVDVEEPRKSWA